MIISVIICFCYLSPVRWDFQLRNRSDEGNTGFYFVRSNERTIRLFTDVVAIMPKYSTIPHCSQERFISNSHPPSPCLSGKSILTTKQSSGTLCGKVHIIRLTLDLTLLRRSLPNSEVLPLSECRPHAINISASAVKELPLVSCPLDNCAFSSCTLNGGMFDFATLAGALHARRWQGLPGSIHANCLKGNEMKVKSLRAHNLWLASGEDSPTGCAALDPALTTHYS